MLNRYSSERYFQFQLETSSHGHPTLVSKRCAGDHYAQKAVKLNLRLTQVNSLAVLAVAVQLEVVDAAVGDQVAVYLRYSKNRRRTSHKDE